MGTMEQFAKNHGITLSHEYADRNPYWDDKAPANHYRCILRHQERRYTLFFSMGIGITHPPTVAEVLSCLASDSAGVENARSFEDWCGDYGYDSDSIKANKIYHGCRRESERLKKLIGEALYHELVWETESL